MFLEVFAKRNTQKYRSTSNYYINATHRKIDSLPECLMQCSVNRKVVQPKSCGKTELFQPKGFPGKIIVMQLNEHFCLLQGHLHPSGPKCCDGGFWHSLQHGKVQPKEHGPVRKAKKKDSLFSLFEHGIKKGQKKGHFLAQNASIAFLSQLRLKDSS